MFLAAVLATSLNIIKADTVECNALIKANLIQSVEILDKAIFFKDWPKFVCSKFTREYENVSFKLIGSYNITGIRSEENKLGVIQIGEISAGRTKVTWSPNDGTRKKTLWLSIRADKSVWIFQKDMRPEQKIKRSNVRRETVNIANIRGLRTLTQGNPVGKSTLKMVRKGQPVTEDLISDPPLIKKNGEIRIIASNGKITITARGIALETAWTKGERIYIRVYGAEESILGTVSGENIAHVQI